VRNQLKQTNVEHCTAWDVSVYCKSFLLTNHLFLHSRGWNFLIRSLIPGTFKCAVNQISDQIDFRETGEAQTTIMLDHGLQFPDCTLYNLSLQQTQVCFSHMKLVPVMKVVVAHSR